MCASLFHLSILAIMCHLPLNSTADIVVSEPDSFVCEGLVPRLQILLQFSPFQAYLRHLALDDVVL